MKHVANYWCHSKAITLQKKIEVTEKSYKKVFDSPYLFYYYHSTLALYQCMQNLIRHGINAATHLTAHRIKRIDLRQEKWTEN